MVSDPRLAPVAVAAVRNSLDAAVRLLAAGSSAVLKQAGVLSPEAAVANMVYEIGVAIATAVEVAEERKRQRADEKPG